MQSASISGDPAQFGTYQNPQGTYGLPQTGIVLSSGSVSDYATGPNTDDGLTSIFSSPASAAQNNLLQPITGQSSHNDVAELNISFIAPANISEVTFFGVFGSEEFPEFVGSGFIDGFGLFVNGTNVAGVQPTGGGGLLSVNINHPDMQARSGTELDGVLAPNNNPVLRFDVPVTAGQANDFKIIVADASDSSLDTTVYLSSFFSAGGGGGGIPAGETEFDPLLPSNPPDPVTGEFEIELPDVPPGTTIWIDPPVAVGYEYAIDNGNAFATFTAPSLATIQDLDGYTIDVGGVLVNVLPGQMLDFLAEFGLTPSAFTLTGIDPSLGLDPSNPVAFPSGVSTVNGSLGSTVTMTPITVDTGVIPLPGGLALYLGALGVFGGWRLRRRAA